MSGYYLKNKEKGIYLKNIDTKNEKIEFTNKQSEAKQYVNGQWFGETEKEFALFHFPQEKKILEDMECVYEE